MAHFSKAANESISHGIIEKYSIFYYYTKK